MMTAANHDVAKTILQQLGNGQFLMMTGAKALLDGNKLHIVLARGIKIIVELTPMDLYNVTKLKFSRKTMTSTVLETREGIYAEDLRETFTSLTGLYCTLKG
jgi:hypothetical protein